MSVQIARCACGALQATVTGAPIRVSLCHCDACRTRSGSAFSWNARFASEDVAIAGDHRSFARKGDEGSTISYHFCPSCGVTVWYENDQVPGIAIPVGTFPRGAQPKPGMSVYHDRLPDWLALTDPEIALWD